MLLYHLRNTSNMSIIFEVTYLSIRILGEMYGFKIHHHQHYRLLRVTYPLSYRGKHMFPCIMIIDDLNLTQRFRHSVSENPSCVNIFALKLSTHFLVGSNNSISVAYFTSDLRKNCGESIKYFSNCR